MHYRPSARHRFSHLAAFAVVLLALSAIGGSAAAADATIWEQAHAAAPSAPIPGTVDWTVDRDDSGATVLHGVARFETTGLILEMDWTRNTDATIPASHIVDLRYELADGATATGIANLVGLLMKDGASERGTPLLGASARIRHDEFLYALSSGDVPSNMRLLETNGYFDLAVLYEDGRRTIVTLALGDDGRKALDEALAAWAAE